MKKGLFAVTLCMIISGCGVSIKGEVYEDATPYFDPFKFFNSDVKAWGIVQDRSGQLIQRFTVNIRGSVSNNNVLTLDETFKYGVGNGTLKRVWKIEKEGAKQFRGTASDIKNNATGRVYGNAMQWSYNMELPVNSTSYTVHFDDWMWAFDSDTIVNRSYISKFGIVMAEVTIFMQKQRSTRDPH
ncbi:DUF3833 family protein [Pseudoalteromonas sp. MMG013]|uniref:DUF3833 family protein n=1 Tax=Pseudoalteromonas sp. MMG013 TaxID=2822687 RepID=UPI001B378B12|nr:DUF3833 family protein [Pseudoalteromonas sp. MMG013]MBQ4860428.1 DUF3833 family protein [Pseudoalteromonas sp. MMG013]